MSLDFELRATRPITVFSGNITHNLTTMAREAGVYEVLWHPAAGTLAADLITTLERGLENLSKDPKKFQEFDSPNGWGRYDNLCAFVANVLAACRANPDAVVEVSI